MATILTVDGDPIHVETLVPMLENEGHEVYLAPDRGRAFQLLDSHAVDLIIIDPDSLALDGLEFCQQLRGLNAARPLLVLATSADDDRILQAFAAGADDYIVKPVSRRILFARIDALLRRVDQRFTQADRQFAALRRMLDRAWEIPLKPSVQAPFRELAQAISGSVEATYCRFAVREGAGRLRIKASAGHRSGLESGEDRSWPLASLPRATAAIGEGRSVVLDLEHPAPLTSTEREQLFTRLTRSAVLLPFASDRVEGVLVVGEERQARHDPFEGEHLASLEYVAHRVGDILRMSELIRRVRVAERRRQLQAVKRIERTRLARELHDEVGQSLSGLLIRLRLARTEGSLSADDIGLLEQAAQDALDAARSVAFDLRHQSGATDAFKDARAFAEQVLFGSGCRLSWIDDHTGALLDTRTARTVASVIKESVTNVVRHARAQATEVKIEAAGQRLRVTVQDDGEGFVAGTAALNRSGRGLGLLGNRERLAQLGGSFRIDSFPGAGTSVVVELPLRRRLVVARAG